MKTSLLIAAGVSALALFTSGCSTSGQSAAFNARAHEKSETFDKLTPAQQKYLEDGWVERGYTPDMVYMVMGAPTATSTKDVNGRKFDMWTYVEFRRNGGGAQDTRNNPDNSHYTTQTVIPNSADVHTQYGSPPDQIKPLSFSGTNASMGQLNVAELNRSKVYLFFADGRVTEIKVETES